MATTINADTSTGGAIVTGDASGELALQAAGSTQVTVNGSGVALTNPLPVGSGGTGATSLSGITVGTATNATNATTATNLAGGSNGTIPYQSAAGTTQMLAVGTSGQVLQTNGVGAPTWVTPSAGSMVFLSTVTASAASTVDIENTFDATYDTYVLIVSNMTLSTGSGVALYCRMKIDGVYQDSAPGTYSYHSNVSSSSANTYSGLGGDGLTYIQMQADLQSASGANAGFTMQIYNPSSTTTQKGIAFTGFRTGGAQQLQTMSGSAANKKIEALTGIRFYTSAGTLSGVFRLYGIKNS
jgi:hypothetical protein